MNRVVKILMSRDNISEAEAQEMVDDARSELMDAIDGTNCLTPEDVMYEELGLELDYLFDVLGF